MRKIIQRDCLDDFEAFGMANRMEKCGIDVFCITNNPWKVWGKTDEESFEKFCELENDPSPLQKESDEC